MNWQFLLSLSRIRGFSRTAPTGAGRVFPKFRKMTRTIPICAALALTALFAMVAEAQTLRGSRASVNRIHSQALAHDLRFYSNGSAVRSAAERGDLVRLRPDANFTLAAVSYPYVIESTRTFVVRLAAQYRSACGEQLVVTSAARPTSMRLRNGTDKSVHPTGMAIDLRKPRNARCLNWLRSTLLTLEAAGLVEAVEERNPPHFHVAVFPRPYTRYVQARTGSPQVASASAPAARAVAAAAADGQSYRVRRGDSLWTIARRNNVTVERLQSANSLRSSRIVAGQILTIPPAR